MTEKYPAPKVTKGVDLIVEVPNEIDLPELRVDPDLENENGGIENLIDQEILAVLMEDSTRHVSIVSERHHDKNVASLELPMPPQLVRNLVQGHSHIRVSQVNNSIKLSSANEFDPRPLDLFVRLRTQAEEILKPLYEDLFVTVRGFKGYEIQLNQHGAKIIAGGVDISHFYSPYLLVCAYIAARSIGQLVVFNQHSTDAGSFLVPEITGDVGYEDICKEFNIKIEALYPRLKEHNLLTAFCSRSSQHDGLDICSIAPDGNGGYVNISRDLALYMYGTDSFNPEFLQEPDMLMVSVNAGEPFACADAAQWINFEAWKIDETFKD